MTSERRQVLIAGAPTGCWTNTGDEAILAAMSQDLRGLDPDLRIQVVSSNPPGVLERFGIDPIPYNDIPQLVAAARSSSLMVLGGGSIFYDYWRFDPDLILTSRHEGLSFYAGIPLLATILNKPLMLYAVGVGPLRSEAGRSLTLAAFEQADIATVRDADSKSLMVSFGLDPSRVSVTADPAFNLQPAEETRIQEIIDDETKQRGLSQPVVGVILRNWDVGIDEDRWQRAVADALDRFVETHGGTVIFVPFHKTVDWPLTDDLGLAVRVKSLMRRKDSTIIFRSEYSPEEKSGILAHCDLVLGMRLHSLILGQTNCVPTVAVTFDDPKVQSALTAVGFGEYGVSISDLNSDRLVGLLNRAYENRAQVSEVLFDRLVSLKELALQNAKMAVEAIAGGPGRKRDLSPISESFLKRLYEAPERYEEEMQSALIAFRDSRAGKKEARTRALGHSDSKPQDLGRRTGNTRDTGNSPPSELANSLQNAERSAAASSERLDSPARLRRTASKPRVACLTNRLLDWDTREPRFGGAERYCVALGELLRSLGFEVTFFQVANTQFVGEYYGFEVIALAAAEYFSEFQHGVCDSFFDATRDYDHVIYNMPNYASGKVREDALLICHDVWWDHHSYCPEIVFRTPEWFNHLYRAFSGPRKIVCVDTNSINVIRALWPDLAARMTYVPNWVDTDRFHPSDSRNGKKPTVLFPRRSEIIRGAGILGAILDGVPHDCRFRWWLGEGTDEGSELVKAVARRDRRLEFYSVPSYEQMNSIYHQADICVIPSIASEATSLACLEALASGCAVVATNIGGLPNLVQPEVNGLLVDPEPRKIAAAINHLLEEPEERARLQSAGRRTAEGFSLGIWQRRWTELIEDLGWIDRSRLTPKQQPKQEPNQQPKREIYAVPAPMKTPEPDTAVAGYDVICFSIIDWEFRWQRPQHIMSQFANHGHRVFFLSTSRFGSADDGPFKVVSLRKDVWEIQLRLPQPINVYGGEMSSEAARLVADNLRALRDEYNITTAVSVLQVASWAPAAYILRDELGWSIVYDCMDNWSSFPGMETENALLELERGLVRNADLLVVSSQTLWDKWSADNSNAVLARNATDFSHFHDVEPNTLLADAPRPIIGYFGAIAEWFDLELMLRLATERPQYTFVLLGGVFGVPVDELSALPNVRLLGQQDYGTMPAYLLQFDVCIIPFEINAATEAMDVVKFYEYVTQGKPVVAPRLPEILTYGDYLYIADDQDDFIHKVDLAVQENDAHLREQRVALARDNTWESRLKTIKSGIERALRRIRLKTILKIVADLFEEIPDTSSEKQEPTDLLKRLALHLTDGLAEREQAAEVLKHRVTQLGETLKLTSNHLNGEIETLSIEKQHLTDAMEALSIEKDSLTQTIETLSTDKNQLTETVGALSADLEAKGVLIAAQDGIVAHLETENTSLRDYLAELSRQHAEKEQSLETTVIELTETQKALAESQAQLEQINRSLGWRLLKLYGPIKYRYLLPLYRMLRLMPPSQTKESNNQK